jgi:hypothetical protein
MYYSLNTDGRENVYMLKEPGSNSHVALAMGRRWDVQADDIVLPYKFEMSVVEGQAPKLYGWYPGSCLMQQKLVDALEAAGVDNLQTFPTVVRRKDTGEEVPGYVAVSIVGRVKCAVMTKSDAEPLATSNVFHKLTIDPARTGGQLMFRLRESSMVVLVHETVAKAIEAGGFLGLTLEPVAEASP